MRTFRIGDEIDIDTKIAGDDDLALWEEVYEKQYPPPYKISGVDKESELIWIEGCPYAIVFDAVTLRHSDMRTISVEKAADILDDILNGKNIDKHFKKV